MSKNLTVIDATSTAIAQIDPAADAAIAAALNAAQAEMDAIDDDLDFGLDFAGAFAEKLPRDPKAAKQGKTDANGLTPVMRRMLWTWSAPHNWRAIAAANLRGQNVDSTAQLNRKVGDAILYACTSKACPVVQRTNAPHFTVAGWGEVHVYGQRDALPEEQRYQYPPNLSRSDVKHAPAQRYFTDKRGNEYPRAKYEGPAF